MVDETSAWAVSMHRRSLAPSSIEKFTRRVRMIQDHYGKPARDLTTDEIETYLDTRNLGATTRYAWISTLHTFYRWRTIHHPTGDATDPTAAMVRPKIRPGVPRPVPDTDLQTAVATAPDPVRAWIVLGGWAGLRCAEIAGLTAEDILTDQGVLLVNGKGGRERLVPIHPRVADVLPHGGRGPLWRRPDGRTYPAAYVSRAIGEHFDAIGMAWTAHQLRHRFATRVHQATGDLLVTQGLLGHSSPTTTAIYAQFSTDRAAEAVRAVA